MKFNIGDRVRVTLGPDPRPLVWHKVGAIGVVASAPYVSTGGVYTRYKLDITPPGDHGIWEKCLELVPPDKEQTVKWHECAWSPRALPVFAPGDTKVNS